MLFCFAISPVAKAMRETKGYYCQAMRQKLTHLFFVDDIKVYAGSSKEFTEMLKIVQDSSKAVGMALGLAKHGVAHMKRAKIMAKGDDILQNEDLVPEITSNKLYQYLGVAQLFSPATEKIQKLLAKRYYDRLRQIWASSLNAKREVHATNMWRVAVLGYYMTVIGWSSTTLDRLDKKTKSIIRKYKGHHR